MLHKAIDLNHPLSKGRHTGLDCLRVLASFFVVVNHAWFLPSGSPSIERWATAFVYALVLPAVPLFVLLSGAFILTRDKTINAKEFYIHSLKKLFPISSFFFIIYLICKTDILRHFLDGRFTLSETFLAIARWYVHGASTPLWYLCMLPGLYLLAPLLSYIRKRTSLFFFGLFSIFFLFISFLSVGLHWNILHPLSAVCWLGFFCMGAWLMLLGRVRKLPSKSVCFIAWLICTSAAVVEIASSGGDNSYEILGVESWMFAYSASIFLFPLFCQWHPKDNRIIAKLSELSLLIYLMHVLVQAVIRFILLRMGLVELLHETVWANFFFALGSLFCTCVASWIAQYSWCMVKTYCFVLCTKARGVYSGQMH